MNNEILELVNGQDGIGTLSISTGELVLIFDPHTSVEEKADSYAFIITALDAQIEVHKAYTRKHKDKIEKILLLQEKVREAIKAQMENQGLTKVKTPENTLYFQERKKLLYDLNELPFEACETELVKKKPLKEAIPNLMYLGLVKETTTTTLCRR